MCSNWSQASILYQSAQPNSGAHTLLKTMIVYLSPGNKQQKKHFFMNFVDTNKYFGCFLTSQQTKHKFFFSCNVNEKLHQHKQAGRAGHLPQIIIGYFQTILRATGHKRQSLHKWLIPHGLQWIWTITVVNELTHPNAKSRNLALWLETLGCCHMFVRLSEMQRSRYTLNPWVLQNWLFWSSVMFWRVL